MKRMTGRCLCEAVHYEVTGDLGPVFNCHCSKCRRWHGAAFRTRASVNRSQFRWLQGEDKLSVYMSSETVTKTFCSNCGSNLASFYQDRPDIVGLPLGGLDQDPQARPEGHIFVDSKALWYDIQDDLPQFAQWPVSEDRVRETAPDAAE
ncbi:GFA family protein [Gilvimarinus sp. F26214L]|uniref:GFA family protein n=1 Tax=Gilvimarinus sp. DZF01 TaxID=3461371 RepID=UPI0040459379